MEVKFQKKKKDSQGKYGSPIQICIQRSRIIIGGQPNYMVKTTSFTKNPRSNFGGHIQKSTGLKKKTSDFFLFLSGLKKVQSDE